MKFTIEKAPLLKALAHVYRVVEKRNTYPILANILLEADGDALTMRATDLDIEITESVPAAVAAVGKTTVPGHMLHDIVRKLPDGEISFEMKDDASAVVKAGRSRFNLACLSPDSFPDLKSGTFPHTFSIAAAALSKIISQTSFAISNEETRYYLNGIYFHVTREEGNGPEFLRGVATDGHRLARGQCEAPAGAAGMPGIILPKKAVGEIQKLLDGVKDDVQVEVSDNKIRLVIGGVTILSKVIEGTFPDYQRVTPALSNTIAEINIGDLRKAIDRVSTIASDRGGKAIKFGLGPNGLELAVTNPDHGSSTEELEAEWGGDPMEIGFNARYALDVLNAVGGEKVKMSITDAGSPTRIYSDEDPTALYVLMPMRV